MAKILILTSRTGGGHMNLALSLKDMLGARYEVEIIDPYPDAFDQYYALLSRRFLKLWDWQYRCTDNKPGSFVLHTGLGLLHQKRLTAFIERISPRLIITTHALLSYAVARANAQANKRTGKHIPLVFQLTDLEQVHSTWFTEKHARAYLAPTREVFAQALAHGIDQKRLHTTGRPVRAQFLQTYDAVSRAETLASLDLDPAAFTIFLQGGAKGSAGIDRTVHSVLAASSPHMPVQIILAAGNNRTMASRFAGVHKLRVLPFTELIAPYMAASDLVVGKAGASFLTEAVMLEKPFLITAYIPGQEGPNLRFLERYNLGWTCLQPGLQVQLIAAIAHNPAMISEKVGSIRTYKTWNSSANAGIHGIIDGIVYQAPLVPY